MKNWTDSATQRLEEFLTQRPKEWNLQGKEAEDLAEDLRTHIHEEITQQKLEMVTLEDLERVLRGLGGTPPPLEQPREGILKYKVRTPKRSFLLWSLMWLTLVLAPISALVLDGGYLFCADAMFPTMPTFWHFLVLSGTVCFIAISAIRFTLGKPLSSLGAALGVGFSLVVSTYYALLFLPISHIAFIGIIFFGAGLLPLSPLFATIWLVTRWFRMKKLGENGQPYHRRLWIGVLAGLITLTILDGPSYLIRYHLDQAARGDEASVTNEVRWLRDWAPEEKLQKICSEAWTASDAAGWVWDEGIAPRNGRLQWSDDRLARVKIYFRVTGRELLNEPPLRLWNDWNQRVWRTDMGRGGDRVAGQNKSLRLTESRIDAHLDAASQLYYQEWTCVFTNDGLEAAEARCQIQLPPQGVVSRLTLWVNGEPREAAFNSISKVKAAYKDVVQVQMRDPVLVNVCGPDRVFVQCFPVPARGGKMQIRLGITTPLTEGRCSFPYLLEHNFELQKNLEHQIWAQGDTHFSCPALKLESKAVNSVPALAMSHRLATLDVPPELIVAAPPDPKVWTEDPFATEDRKFVSRTFESKTIPPIGKPIIVIDGSRSMREFFPTLRSKLGDTQVIHAGDTLRELPMSSLTASDFDGGCDNVSALARALTLAQQRSDSAIVWLHGPQPVSYMPQQQLLQLIDHGRSAAVIYDVPMRPGPNPLQNF